VKTWAADSGKAGVELVAAGAWTGINKKAKEERIKN
jgi:hypothetical protein